MEKLLKTFLTPSELDHFKAYAEMTHSEKADIDYFTQLPKETKEKIVNSIKNP